MPHQPSLTEIRFNNIVTCLRGAVTTVEIISKALETPFLPAIASTMKSLLLSVQSVKKHHGDCARMMEQIHELLYAIIRLHVGSDTSGELSPNMLKSLGMFTETLHKVHNFVEAQQDKNTIRQFFRRHEMNTLLKDCDSGLEQALNVFKVQGIYILDDITVMQQYAQKMHQEVLELVSSLLDEESSHSGSIISRLPRSSRSSSNSLSLLPSKPKIFHGRQSEVSVMIQTFSQEVPRIAILGPGGIRKTSLAKMVLHHPEICARYQQHRVFVACDTVSSSVQLTALIGSHLGLKPGKDLTRPVIHHLSNNPAALMILDNLESIWEPRESRGEIENFLALLADVEHLALIITMRGAERPGMVQWTHPFLAPLKPLTPDAARRIFIDIADDGHASEDVDKILSLADNMPLAIDLMAHLVAYEGVSSVLNRWQTETTSLLSNGYDKGSNLDLSISLSLASPRMMSSPQSQDLLSLLCILPDGLSDLELLQSKLPISNVLGCKVALLRTSLAYTDDQKRLKVLIPIREHVNKMHPPMPHIVRPIFKHFEELLEIHKIYFGTASNPGIVTRITLNFANIENVLVKGLRPDNPDLVSTIYCTCHFDRFSRQTGHGQIQAIHQIPKIFPHPSDQRLEVYVLNRLIAGWRSHPIQNVEYQVRQALEHFPELDDSDLKCKFYDTIIHYYRFHNHDIPRAICFSQAALSLSTLSGNTNQQVVALSTLAGIEVQTGDYFAAQAHAYESRQLASSCGDLFGEATALRTESLCWYRRGSYQHSVSLCQRARHLLGLCAMSGGSLDHTVMNSLAEVHRSKSEYAEARNIQTQILQNISARQDPLQHAFALLNIAEIDIEIGVSNQDVQTNIGMAKSLLKSMGWSVGILWSDAIQAALHAIKGDVLLAQTLFQSCLLSVWGKDVEIATYCLQKLSEMHYWGAMDYTSSTWRILFLVHTLKFKERLGIYKALQYLGDMYLAEGDQHIPISLFTVALEGFTLMDVHRSRGECMLWLGDLSKLNGDILKAVELWTIARPLLEYSSQTKQLTGIDERLAGNGHSLLVSALPTSILPLAGGDEC